MSDSYNNFSQSHNGFESQASGPNRSGANHAGPNDTESEAQLVARVQSGCQESANELFHLLQAYFIIVVRSMLGDRLKQIESVEDVCQLVLCRVLVDLPALEYQGARPFRTWLRLRAVRQILDLHDFHTQQKRDYRKTSFIEDVRRSLRLDSDVEFRELVNSTRSIASRVAAMEEQRILGNAIGELEETRAEIIRLRDLDGLKFSEVATLLEKSERQVRYHHRQAQAQLAAKLLPQARE